MVYLINVKFMKREIKSAIDNAKALQLNLESGLRHSILREASVVDEFYLEKCCNDDGTESISFVDPIRVLFNQERLNNMGVSAGKAFLDSLMPQSDALAELRGKCSDDDLLCMVKSRHLQSPAEILSWCRYMQSNVDAFNSEVQKLVEAQTAQQSNNLVDNNTNTE